LIIGQLFLRKSVEIVFYLFEEMYKITASGRRLLNLLIKEA